MQDQRARMPLNQEFEEVPDPDQRVIWYDLSELSVRPDRSGNTITLHTDFTVSDEAVLRETGLDATDLLTDDAELRRRLGVHMALNPATAEMGLELLGMQTVAKVAEGTRGVVPTDGLAPEESPTPPGDLPANDGEQGPPPAGVPEPSNGHLPVPVAAG
jgi:hypothetical protein